MTNETLNAIKADAETLRDSAWEIAEKINLVEAGGVTVPDTVDTAFESVVSNINVIITWVEQAITDGGNTGEIGVMQAMLAELKAVFDKYAAVIEYVSSGYGEDMGENYGGASFYRLTATDPVNGNVETKDIVSATLSSEQLV